MPVAQFGFFMTKQDIVIRATEPGDFAAFQEIHAQPKVIWGTTQLPFRSAESWRKRMENPSPFHHRLVAEIDGRAVGAAGILLDQSPRRRHSAGLGMSVHDDWHGQGVGKALMDLADNWLDLHRIELQVYVDNAPAIALYQQFGFEIEGTLRHHTFRGGQYLDALTMARLSGVEN